MLPLLHKSVNTHNSIDVLPQSTQQEVVVGKTLHQVQYDTNIRTNLAKLNQKHQHGQYQFIN